MKKHELHRYTDRFTSILYAYTYICEDMYKYMLIQYVDFLI